MTEAAIPLRLSLSEGTKDDEYNIANHLLTTTAPARTYIYDADGNLTQGYTQDDDVFTAEYDAENRLTSLEYTDSSGVLHRQKFRYSGGGLLAEQTFYENGVLVDTLRIVRDGMLALQDRDGENASAREYTWGLNLGGGIGGLLNLKTAGQNYAYLYDGKGNVEAVLDASQNVVAAYRYDPFGVLLANTASFEQPFGFSTKRTDARTGIVFYQYRPYGPGIGKWFTRDPLGEAGGLNLYAFVGNNPVNWVDPWGLQYAGDLGGQLTVELIALLAELKAFLGTGVAISGATLSSVGAGIVIVFLPSTAECPTLPPISLSKEFDEEQQIVIELAKKGKKTGLSEEETKALVELGNDVGLPSRGPEEHPNRPHGRNPHIHVGPINHIPVN